MCEALFRVWYDELQPIQTKYIARERRKAPGRVCEYTMPFLGDRVIGHEAGKWFGEGVLTYKTDTCCEVLVDRPFLSIVGVEPFTAATRLEWIRVWRPDMPQLGAMWRITWPYNIDWAKTTDGRMAAAEADLRIIESRTYGLLIGTDRMPATQKEWKNQLEPYFDRMVQAKVNEEPPVACQQ